MLFDAPSGSFFPRLATIGAAAEFVVEGCFVVAAFFLAAASGAVVPEVGRDAVGMTVGDFFVIVVFSLCLGFDFRRVVYFVFLHQRLEDFFESVSGEGGIGIVVVRSGRRWCRGKIAILVFVVGRLLLVEWHVVDELL